MADKTKTEQNMVRFESSNSEPDSSSDSSKGEDSSMDWNHAAVMVLWQPKPCLRQSLSRMASSARTRIGSFHATTGLGHGGLMDASQPLKDKSSNKYCKHSQAEPYTSDQKNGKIWKKRKLVQFCNQPSSHIKRRIKTEGSSHEGVQDHSAYILGTLSGDVPMEDSSDEAMEFLHQGNDDAMRGQKRSHNDTEEDDEIETGDSAAKRMAVD